MFYIGTYTSGASEGIYRARLAADGSLALTGVAARSDNPSFLALDDTRRVLYAVNELAEGEPGGSVSAFAVDPASGALTLLNRQSSRGGSPCHLSLDASRRFLFVANYGGGNVTVLPVEDDGHLGDAVTVVDFEGTGPDADRQEAPHAHMVLPGPSGAHVLVSDLGADRLGAYAFDARTGGLQLAAEAPVTPGSGPRHIAFSPDGRTVYAVNELTSTLSVFDYDGATGAFAALQTLPTSRDDFEVRNYPAHVVAHERQVFVSNRGHNTLAVFDVDPETRQLELAQTVPSGGEWPRHFALDPSGRFLLVAHQRSDTVVTLAVENGRLRPTGHTVQSPLPVCIAFV